MDNKRRWSVKIDNEWVDIPMINLSPGDICKVYESNGQPIYGGTADTVYTVIEKPYKDDNGMLTVVVKT